MSAQGVTLPNSSQRVRVVGESVNPRNNPVSGREVGVVCGTKR